MVVLSGRNYQTNWTPNPNISRIFFIPSETSSNQKLGSLTSVNNSVYRTRPLISRRLSNGGATWTKLPDELVTSNSSLYIFVIPSETRPNSELGRLIWVHNSVYHMWALISCRLSNGGATWAKLADELDVQRTTGLTDRFSSHLRRLLRLGSSEIDA